MHTGPVQQNLDDKLKESSLHPQDECWTSKLDLLETSSQTTQRFRRDESSKTT
jgi:hypothetical protein